MSKSEHEVLLICSPFQPGIEVVGDLVLKLGVPYSAASVTLEVNPEIEKYDGAPKPNVRQVMITKRTKDTQIMPFDFKDNKKKTVVYKGRTYEIELMEISKTNQEGQDFPSFRFKVIEG